MKITTAFAIIRQMTPGHVITCSASSWLARPDGRRHNNLIGQLCRVKRMAPCDLLDRMDEWRPLDIHPDNAAWDGARFA